MSRARGMYASKTLRQVQQIRKMRAQDKPLSAIGAALGITRNRVWQLCKDFNITSPRDTGPRPVHAMKQKIRYWVPAIDPVKAQAITEDIKAHWRKLGVAS